MGDVCATAQKTRAGLAGAGREEQHLARRTPEVFHRVRGAAPLHFEELTTELTTDSHEQEIFLDDKNILLVFEEMHFDDDEAALAETLARRGRGCERGGGWRSRA